MGKYNAILLYIILAVLCVGIVSAAGTYVWPASTSTRISGSKYWVQIETDLKDVANCTISASSASTGDSLAATVITDTVNNTHINGSIDTTALEDANDWVFTGTVCYNLTGTKNTSITPVTGRWIDNTVPSVPTGLSPTSSTDENNVGPTWTSTVGAANTTACTLLLTDLYQTRSYSMTHSGTTCTYTGNLAVASQGDVSWIVRASDGTNTTDSASTTIAINDKGGAGNIPTDLINTGSNSGSNNNNTTLIVIGLAIAAYIMYTQGEFGGKSGRKRKR